jgi:hypothetical protein
MENGSFHGRSDHLDELLHDHRSFHIAEKGCFVLDPGIALSIVEDKISKATSKFSLHGLLQMT